MVLKGISVLQALQVVFPRHKSETAIITPDHHFSWTAEPGRQGILVQY